MTDEYPEASASRNAETIARDAPELLGIPIVSDERIALSAVILTSRALAKEELERLYERQQAFREAMVQELAATLPALYPMTHAMVIEATDRAWLRTEIERPR